MFIPKMRQPDGQVLDANLKINNGKNPSDLKFNNFGLQKAMILESKPVDDKNNKYKKSVEYTAVIVGGPRDGEFISNLVALDAHGGADNFEETVYAPKTEVLRGKNKGDKTPAENTNGSYVLVGFVSGHYNSPVILSGWPQPNSDHGATMEDGIVKRGRFQGMNYSVNKDGVLELNKDDTTITIDSQNQITIDSDKPIVINSSDTIELGEGATEAVIKGDAFKSVFDAHVHSSGGSGPPTVPMPASNLSEIVKVK